MSPTSYRTAPPRAKFQSSPNTNQGLQDPEIENSKSTIGNRKSQMTLVGLGRFELPTSRLSGVRSNQLSYRPMSPLRVFSRKKEPHFSSVRSVFTVDAPEGRVASVAIEYLRS